MRSEFFRECGIVGPTANRCNLVTELVCELHSEMTKAADTEDRNQIPRQRTAMPQRVVGSDSCAEKRRCIGVAETSRYGYQRLDRSEHVLLVSPVIADTANLYVSAVA